MGENKSRTFVIGLDGVSFNVLMPFVDKGIMPNLKNILENSCYGDLLSTIPPYTAPAWASFMTGINPGKHGVISFFRNSIEYNNIDPSIQMPVNSNDIEGITLWDILGAFNKKIGIINVPLTFPAKNINGFMISGMDTPLKSDKYYYPPSLSPGLDNYIIDILSGVEGPKVTDEGFMDRYEIFRQSKKMMEIRADTVLELMEGEKWDFFMVVFTSTDRILHYFWEYFEDSKDKNLNKKVESFFGELDKQIGNIVSRLNQYDNLMIISDHGFTRAPKKVINLNTWLQKQGFLFTNSKVSLYDSIIKLYQNHRLRNIVKIFVPKKSKRHFQERFGLKLGKIIDWNKTKAYYVYLYNHICGIEINKDWVKKERSVSKEEYEIIRKQLIKKVSRLVDPENGRSVVEKVFRREEMYSGKNLEKIPDIILILKPEYKGGRLFGDQIFMKNTSGKYGDHKQEGIFIFSGPNAKHGKLDKNYSIMDIAPTISYLMKIPISNKFDGEIISDAFNPSFLAENPIRYQDITKKIKIKERKKAETIMSEEDVNSVKKRLKDIGYLE